MTTTADDTHDTNTLEQAFSGLIRQVAQRATASLQRQIDLDREQHPWASDEEVAQRLVRSIQRQAGTAGALTGVGGFLTLPVTVPASMLASWTFGIKTVLGVALVYGHDLDEEQLRFDVLSVLFADTVKETLSTLGVEGAKNVSKKAVDRFITRDVMKVINAVVPRRVLTKAGEKSATSFTKLAPLVGAPVGYVFEHLFIKSVGAKAIQWYGPEPAPAAGDGLRAVA